jgi:hypothetical protein
MAMGLSHALETRYRRRSIRGRPLYEDESERISIMAPESTTPLKAEYIGADQLSSLIFRLQLCGGPYMSGNAGGLNGSTQHRPVELARLTGT